MGRRKNPPRILKLLQEQPHLFAAKTKKGRCLPPRMLKLQQHGALMMETERFITPRMLKLRQENLQQRSKLRETHVEVQQEDILLLWQTLMDRPRAFLGRQEPLLHLQGGWIEVGQSMPEQVLQERQQVEVEIEQTLAEKEYQSRLEQNLANEPIIDYSRLTSFLKQDSSFLTPWNWNGRNHTDASQIQNQEKGSIYIPESYFSYSMSR
ncbi:hypothetical protein Patl1_16755 [Pistacia atlantica]|uniref:Uncharacterized protein n=1 Tax=Pistacia atlantica TaxID=434234 RepID=A0ACC1B5V4_9ROSI|nr:hypothetical protein Patl1_16755 [Pistacia atlantica]